MLCQFDRLIYPQTNGPIAFGSFMIATYFPCETVRDSLGNLIKQFKAIGYCLPTAEGQKFELHGHWSKSQKHGLQFEVDTYDEVITPTKEGVIAYLSSGQIKGIGPRIAEMIYDAFGTDTLDILDKEPEKLLSISGISDYRLKKIRDSYMENRAARDVVASLVPYGVTANKAVKFYREYGSEAIDIVKNKPYKLSEIDGIGFKTADQIAMNMGYDRMCTDRADEALLYTLVEAENSGHLCMEKHAFIKACLKLLETPQMTEEMLANRAARLVYSGALVVYEDKVYRSSTAYAELHLAERLSKHIRNSIPHSFGDLDMELDYVEQRMRIRFADEQRNAVKMALTSGISIITGGPGTGKTAIQRAILDIYHRRYPNSEICCCAPTGRAARRMEQSTGYPASTVHKALCLNADDNGVYNSPEMLDADFIVVDEVSMLDIYLAGFLVDAVKSGAQLVLIGDADQLPSVGPGAVLSELIASGRIPVVKLDKVFRQSAGSRIAVNAKLIRHGNVSLEYGTDFQFVDSSSIPESAKRIADIYIDEVARYGVDNVAMLTPYRQKTETGANALNQLLQEKINPPDETKGEIIYRNRVFRCGDKVMQIKNYDDVNNGDIGYIRKITNLPDDAIVLVDFGDGREKEYESSQLEMLDLGYASTVHKVQGSEFKSVIINLQKAHYIMLTRPLVYTAITRGKDKVIVVGERRAMCMAIKKTDTEKRGTCLAHRLQELI